MRREFSLVEILEVGKVYSLTVLILVKTEYRKQDYDSQKDDDLLFGEFRFSVQFHNFSLKA